MEAYKFLSSPVTAVASLVYPSAPALTDNEIEYKEKYNKDRKKRVGVEGPGRWRACAS